MTHRELFRQLMRDLRVPEEVIKDAMESADRNSQLPIHSTFEQVPEKDIPYYRACLLEAMTSGTTKGTTLAKNARNELRRYKRKVKRN